MKRLAPIVALVWPLCLASCEPVAGPDLRPVGDGLHFLGFAIVLAAIILIVGFLLGRGKP